MYIDVVAAAIASMVLGMLWYGPVFGKTWAKLSGIKMDAKKKGMWPAYLATFVGSLITAYVLNTFLSFAGAATPEAAALVGAWAWLGFVATTSLGGVLWKGESTNLYLLNGAHGLINFALMAVVLVLVV